MSPVLRVLTHIYRVSKELDVKTFIFGVNLGLTFCCEPKFAISINFVKQNMDANLKIYIREVEIYSNQPKRKIATN